MADPSIVSGPTDIVDRLQLARTNQVGPVTYGQLIARFGTAARALDALPDLVRKVGGQPFRPAPLDDIRREIDAVAKLGARHMFVDSDDYPALLAQLGNAPVVLIARGQGAIWQRPAIAMVGARNASAAACRFARQLAGELGERGYTVVSGLARGIDTAAHSGAMAHGTVGVIASGIDRSFPPENRDLQEAIATGHLLVTEYPPGTEPLARHFPHRNRIIAGSTLGTVVVEAAPRSGSLLTAKMATDAGREVMAVPGSPLDPRAQGCNGLIREGATLVQSASDIAEAVASIDARMVRQDRRGFGSEPVREPEDTERDTLVSLLGPVAVPVDELIRQSGLSPQAVQLILLDLELAGRLERQAAGWVSLIY